MLMIFEVGDISGDGHREMNKYFYEIFGVEELKDLKFAFLKGCQHLQLEFINSHHSLSFTAFEDYEDRTAPEDMIQKLTAAGFEIEDFFFQDWDRGKNKVWKLEAEMLPELWLAVAAYGDPKLSYEPVAAEKLDIGGYGLFSG